MAAFSRLRVRAAPYPAKTTACGCHACSSGLFFTPACVTGLANHYGSSMRRLYSTGTRLLARTRHMFRVTLVVADFAGVRHLRLRMRLPSCCCCHYTGRFHSLLLPYRVLLNISPSPRRRARATVVGVGRGDGCAALNPAARGTLHVRAARSSSNSRSIAARIQNASIYLDNRTFSLRRCYLRFLPAGASLRIRAAGWCAVVYGGFRRYLRFLIFAACVAVGWRLRNVLHSDGFYLPVFFTAWAFIPC